MNPPLPRSPQITFDGSPPDNVLACGDLNPERASVVWRPEDFGRSFGGYLCRPAITTVSGLWTRTFVVHDVADA